MADNLPDLTTAFESDIGSGFEEVTSSDIQIPFLRIIQALSPQLKKSDAGFIQGASSGDIFNTVTKKTWAGEKGVSRTGHRIRSRTFRKW